MIFNILKVKPDLIEKAKSSLFKDLRGKKFWDPAGFVPSVDDAASNASKDYAKYLYLRKYPSVIWKWLGIFIGCFVFLFFLFVFLDLFFVNFLLVILFFIFLFAAFSNLRKVQRSVVKIEVANENNFLFLKESSAQRWKKYKDLYPEIFNRGDDSQRVEDCFWGIVDVGKSKVSFVSGIFHFVTVSYDSRGRQSRHPYWFNFFIAKLPSEINSRFFLYPEGVFSKIKNFFSKKKVHTSSVDFNKTFAFKYKGKKSEKELDILKVLSPRVQEELLRLNAYKRKSFGFFKRKTSGISVLFTRDSVVFFMPGKVIKKGKTNFLKSPSINEADKVYLNKELEFMVNISNDISKYLD